MTRLVCVCGRSADTRRSRTLGRGVRTLTLLRSISFNSSPQRWIVRRRPQARIVESLYSVPLARSGAARAESLIRSDRIML